MTPSNALPTGLARVESLYRALETELEPHRDLCRLRGVCCDFRAADHVLYASRLEVEYLRSRRPEIPRSDGELCPFWRKGLCTARDERPLGCRTYFCDPEWRDRGESIHERYHRELVRIHEQTGVPYDYRPWVASLEPTTHPAPRLPDAREAVVGARPDPGP